MEVVVGVKGREAGFIDNGATDKLGSGLAPLKQVADPVVYKLVRVDFDGRFVPATDDELMEVENLLEHEKSEVISVPGVMGTVGQISDNVDTDEKPLPQKYEDLSQMKFAEAVEEKLRTEAEESTPMSVASSKGRPVKGRGNAGQELSSSCHDGSNKCGSNENSKPNFSLLKGPINLDNLTIKELQETFRATFGRKTTAKDKMWLKRRIAMGLTNSCDVSGTSFIISEGKFLKEEELRKNMNCEDLVAGEVCNAGEDGPVNIVSCSNERGDVVDDDDVELRNSFVESGCRSDDNLENRAAKRARKPTKRYIEELSDREKDLSGKPISSSKRPGQDKSSSIVVVRTPRVVHSNDFVTRPDSIGGSGVQVPYVSRIRRCRPRKSITALTKFESDDVAVSRKSVEIPIPSSELQPDDHRTAQIETKSIAFEEPIASEEEQEKQCLNSMSDISQGREPKSAVSVDNNTQVDTSGNNSDDHVTTAPTPTGGMRRKHHRAWTLTEVMKLVDGVAKFGAGRWSEIKRLSFSSYSHRTSVDLKDKWRNLLKASFASSQADKGMNPRKNAPIPIPATILVKVRELAELNGQAPNMQIVRSSSNNDSGSSVNENRSGYL